MERVKTIYGSSSFGTYAGFLKSSMKWLQKIKERIVLGTLKEVYYPTTDTWSNSGIKFSRVLFFEKFS